MTKNANVNEVGWALVTWSKKPINNKVGKATMIHSGKRGDTGFKGRRKSKRMKTENIDKTKPTSGFSTTRC